uniref:Uncharacterized protein n=1 Tax=Rhizophora mucronata TaxID=61149 RepID=A0A2P2Q218_RHIMU
MKINIRETNSRNIYGCQNLHLLYGVLGHPIGIYFIE